MPSNVPPALRQAVEDFVGREWLLPGIDRWLTTPEEKFLVITGPPGVGKTAICAWLCGAGPPPLDPVAAAQLSNIRNRWNAAHFCSQWLEGGSVDPRFFIRRIATQLAANEPSFGAAALRTLSAPIVRVNISIERNLGEAVGLRTNHLWITGRSIADGFGEAIKIPLELLAQERPEQVLALIVDGIDESLSVGDASIAELLASLADVAANVKVLVSTKPDRRIRNLFPYATRWIDLAAIPARDFNRADVHQYARRRTCRTKVNSHQSNSQDDWTAAEIAEAANENFQYARHLLDEIDAGIQKPNQDRRLPDGLPALYRAYLDRLLPQTREYGRGTEVLNEYLPLLGILAVALEPLPLQTVAKILDWSTARVMTRADELQQVIDFGSGQNPEVRFFHTSMAEFITTATFDSNLPNQYFVGAAEAHAAVARSYLEGVDRSSLQSWDRCDSYGLRHLADHLRASLAANATGLGAEDLYSLATEPAFRMAQRATGSNEAMVRTASAALDHAFTSGARVTTIRLTENFALADEPELNGLATASLVRCYPTMGASDILRLLSKASPTARLVAINAAHRIGFSATDLFHGIALSEDEDLQRLTAYLAYLTWSKGERDAVIRFLADLASSMRLTAFRDAQRRLRFLANASVTIYINRVDDHFVIDWVERLWLDLTSRSLRLGRYSAAVRMLVAPVAGKTMGRLIAEATLLRDLQPPNEYFAHKNVNRLRQLIRIASQLMRPGADVRRAYPHIKELLESDIAILRSIGATVVAAHCCWSLPALESFFAEQFVALSPRARLWHLLGFAVTFPTTVEWRRFVEWQTAYLLENDRNLIVSRDNGIMHNFNALLVPAGLACGKAGIGLTQTKDVLTSALSRADYDLAAALVESLGVVGFYYPAQALSDLRVVCDSRMVPLIEKSMIHALSAISVLHPESIDLFIEETGLGELRAEVRARMDVAESLRSFDRIGFLNVRVNTVVRHRLMREGLVHTCLEALADAASERDFFRRYDKKVLKLLRDHDYSLVGWTADDMGGDCGR